MEVLENTTRSDTDNSIKMMTAGTTGEDDEFIEPIECNEEIAEIIMSDSKLTKKTPVVLLGHQDNVKLNNNDCPTYLMQCRASTCYKFYKDLTSLLIHERQEHNKVSLTFKVVTLRNVNIYLDDCTVRSRFYFRPRRRGRGRNRLRGAVNIQEEECDEDEYDPSEVPDEEDSEDTELLPEGAKRSTSSEVSIVTDPETGTQTYKCRFCTEMFNNLVDVKVHINRSHPKRFSCNICHVGLSSKQKLIKHKKLHQTLKKSFSCTICNINFVRAFDLNEHRLKTHLPSNINPNQCTICFKSYKNFSMVRRHERRIHTNIDKNFPCAICGKLFSRPSKRSEHEKTHNKQRPRNFPCSFCDRKFFIDKHRKKHEDVVHRKIGKESWIHCEVCGRDYRSELTLKNHTCSTLHLNVVHEPELSVGVGQDGRTKVCRINPKVSKTGVVEPRSQEKHSTSISTIIKVDLDGKIVNEFSMNSPIKSLTSIKVDLDGMIIKKPPAEEDVIDIQDEGTLQARFNVLAEESGSDGSKEQIKREDEDEYILPGKRSDATKSASKSSSKDTKSTAEPILIKIPKTGSSCSHCSKKFAERANLKAHIQRVNNKLLGIKFKCPICAKAVSTKTNLKNHLSTHTSEHKFKCKECGQNFRTNHGLKFHTLKHAGKKPFKCTTEGCNAAFVAKHYLRMHELSNHIKIKKFSCSHCGNKFLLKSQLDQHERIHTGEKPLHCKYCNRGFARYNVMYDHEKRHVKYLQKNTANNNNNKTTEKTRN